jgi:O-antigen ligase
MLAGGRLRLLGPSLREAARHPLGEGFATRQTGFTNPLRNAPILDDNWLGLLLEVGVFGVVGWSMLFVRTVRRLGRASRRRAGPEGWLAVGLAGASAGFGVGMFTYDSLTFVQISFVLWILVSLASALLLADTEGAAVGASRGSSLDRFARTGPSLPAQGT